MILDGDDARRARDAVASIGARLDRAEPAEPSLASGAAGLALVAGHRAFAGEPGADERAHACLARAIELIDGAPALDPTLGAGITGVGWVMQHLRALFPIDDDALAPIDAMALELASRDGDAFPFELLHGAVGLGVYGLERGRDDLVAAVVHRLERAAAPAPVGRTWRSPGGASGDARGHHDLGMAHGVPGVIAFLARAWTAGVAAARPILDDAVAWLLAQEVAAARPRFAQLLGAAPLETRHGWCYGDLGIACALVGAGAALGEPRWIDRGLDVARGAARDAEPAEPALAGGFCHGIAGRADMLARLARVGADAVLEDAARRAYRETIDRVAGIDPHPAALAGAGGVAVTLLSALGGSPAWGRAWQLPGS